MKINILAIDDKKENLYLLDNLMIELKNSSEYFSEVKTFKALSGQIGLKTAMSEDIDLIILDIKMPEMNGFEVARFLKMNDKTNDIPIVFLTAEFKETEFIKQGFEVGAIDYFLKPIKKHEFLSKLKLYSNLFLKKKELKTVNTNLEMIIEEKIESENRLQKLFDLQENLLTVTNGHEIQIANNSMCDFLGIKTLDEFTEHNTDISTVFIKSDNYFSLDLIKENENWIDKIQTLNQNNRIVMMCDKNNTPHSFKVSVSEFDKEQYIVSFTDISATINEKNNLNNKLIKDQLTGAYNREFFQQNISSIINDSNEINQLGVVLFDVDYFKKVNDTYGHYIGDNVLKELTNVVESSIRNDDYLIRWGGEEFILLLEVSSFKSLKKVTDNIRQTIQNHPFNDVNKITCSFGATLHIKDEDIKTTIERSDIELYKAKDSGRNNVKLI